MMNPYNTYRNMKNKYHSHLIRAAILSSVIGANAAHAEDVVSGSLSLDANTHFISYGVDVWNDGDSMSEPTFNPSLELAFALPGEYTFTLGTWWDVNGKATNTVGGKIQEVDVWAGISKDFGPVSLGVTYQAWMYGGATEDILDISIGYDCFLSPSLTIHNRLDSGAAGGGTGLADTGTILVLGLEHGIEAGPVSISFPFSVAYFTDEGFHGTGAVAAGGADKGFGYASLGVGFSVPLSSMIGEAYGEWDLHGGLTYYVTSRDVIPGNAEGDFLTANLGLGLSF